MIGKTISHYRITRQLGAGGMGVVYEAVDTNLDRTVALKFLPPELTGNTQAKARFVHEAKAASALDHPNVCTVFEIGETDDGQMFLAMACYQGETLKERIARGPLPLDEAMDITRQVAEGLAKAHERDIVHRDIKPANLFLTDDFAKILDFGLAKLEGQTKITRTGTTLGTASYMSPEQAQGRETDARSDLWCLGVVLYEMVTGHVPFRGENAQAVINGIVTTDPEPATGLRTGIPLELERIIGKCLAKDPRERYQHAEDLLADLRVLQRQTDEQPTATMVTAGDRRKSPRRWPWIAGCVIGAIVAAVFAVQSLRTDPETNREDVTLAVMDLQDLASPDNPVHAVTYASLLSVALVEDSPVRVVSSSYLQELVRRRFGSERGTIASDQALEIADASGAAYMLWGRILPDGQDVSVAWELVEVESRQCVESGMARGDVPAVTVDNIVAEILPFLADRVGATVDRTPTSVSDITTASTVAYGHYVTGMITMEAARPREAWKEFELAVAADSTFSLAYIGLSMICFGTSSGFGRDRQLANRYAEIAWEHRTQLGSKDRLLLDAWRHHVRGGARASLEVYEELRTRYPDDIRVIKDYAGKLAWNWHHGRAIDVAQQGLGIVPEDFFLGVVNTSNLRITGLLQEGLNACLTLTSLHPREPNAWDELGLTQIARGRTDSAAIAFERALTIDPDFDTSDHGLACNDYGRGDLPGAIERLKHILDRPRLPDLVRFEYMIIWNSLGLSGFLAEAGRCREALDMCDAAAAFAGSGRENRQKPGLSRSLVMLAKQNYTGALAEIEAVRRLPDDPFNSLTELCFVEVEALAALGRIAEADTVLARVAGDGGRGWGKFAILAPCLAAKISLARGEPDSALIHLEPVEGYRFDSHPWFIAMWKDIARAHRMAGRPEVAEAEYRDLLRVHGGHALAHYELGVLCEEMDRPDVALDEYRRFLEMWSEADEGMPQVEDTMRRIEALKARI